MHSVRALVDQNRHGGVRGGLGNALDDLLHDDRIVDNEAPAPLSGCPKAATSFATTWLNDELETMLNR